jgi:2'-5' RNA ligase
MPDQGSGATLRLFVACNLPDEVRAALGRVQDDLRRLGADDLRCVRPDGIHITLKFLGAVEAARVEAIHGALAGAVEPFELRVRPSSVGGFGGARLRVVWAGLEGDVAGLAALALRVDEALAKLRFPRERRPFAPHLTLARVPDRLPPARRRELSELVERYQPPPMPEVTLTRVELMRSILGPQGSRYESLAEFPS